MHWAITTKIDLVSPDQHNLILNTENSEHSHSCIIQVNCSHLPTQKKTYKNYKTKHNSMDCKREWRRATRWGKRKDLRTEKRSVKKVHVSADSKGSYWVVPTMLGSAFLWWPMCVNCSTALSPFSLHPESCYHQCCHIITSTAETAITLKMESHIPGVLIAVKDLKWTSSWSRVSSALKP